MNWTAGLGDQPFTRQGCTRNVADVVFAVRVARVLVILLLAFMSVSFVVAIGTPSSGTLEKAVLLAL